MSKEFGEGNQQPGAHEGEQSASSPAGQEQDIVSGEESNQPQPEAPQSEGPSSPASAPPDVPPESQSDAPAEAQSDAPDKAQPDAKPAQSPSAAQPWSIGTGQSVPNLPPHLRKLVEETDSFAKTKLDHDALRGVISRTFAEKEVKVAELKLAQAADSPQPEAPQSSGPDNPASAAPIVPPESPSGAPAEAQPDVVPPKSRTAAQPWSIGTGQSVPNLPPHLRKLVEETDSFAKTKLDHDALKGVVTRTFAQKEVKIAELKLALAAEPPKPYHPIEKYRKALPCSSTWKVEEGTERVGFCEQCKCQVYDFTGMEMPEAEELIFKREARRNVVLYRRKDGKFLTADCPVGVKRRTIKVITSAAAALFAIGVIVFLCLVPLPRMPSFAEQKTESYTDTPFTADTKQAGQGQAVYNRQSRRASATGSPRSQDGTDGTSDTLFDSDLTVDSVPVPVQQGPPSYRSARDAREQEVLQRLYASSELRAVREKSAQYGQLPSQTDGAGPIPRTPDGKSIKGDQEPADITQQSPVSSSGTVNGAVQPVTQPNQEIPATSTSQPVRDESRPANPPSSQSDDN